MTTKEKAGRLQPEKVKSFIIKNNFIVAFVALLVISSILSDSFLSARNFSNLLKQQSAALIVAFGMLFCVITAVSIFPSARMPAFPALFSERRW